MILISFFPVLAADINFSQSQDLNGSAGVHEEEGAGNRNNFR